ncbi:MAG: C4-dicarboxylic acid transporter DauA [Polyangiaceae bacterium]|nr:C4-dicarboxylic acid transporter DauA [Polyangiaceae bacterium]
MLRLIRKRYESARSALPTIKLRPASALREALKEGYGAEDLRADLLAGLVVGIVALPLSMALAIATGVPPQHGLYTAIIAGGATALLGGSRTQVTGPTAAFIVVLVPIVSKFGLGGLLLATMMAGAILIALGAARLGRLIQFIPYPVTTGFTAGIAVVIATLQLKDLLGLTVAHLPEHYVERVVALSRALPTANVAEIGIGALTLALLLLWPRVTRRVPAPLVALALAALAALALRALRPDLTVATIGSRFSYSTASGSHPGIPQLPPLPVLPWTLPGPGGEPLSLSFGMLRALFPSAFAIAMLGAIESLLSAVVADGMAGTKHDPDAELVAQGTGNLLAPFFGGFAATGALARTATNIRSGARSPIAAIVHSAFVLAAVLLLAPLLAYLPMAALAALLLLVAWNMSEVKHFLHVLRVAPKSDVFVQIGCFLLTVLFDMVVAVTAGVIMAALLFMGRMAEISGARLSEGPNAKLREPLPPGVVLYEIAGPLFFGATQKAMSSLDAIKSKTKVAILDLSAVPAMDATGLVNLESALERLNKAKVFIILAGVQPQPARVLQKAGLKEEKGELAMAATIDDAVAMARVLAPPPPAPSSSRGIARPLSERAPRSAG